MPPLESKKYRARVAWIRSDSGRLRLEGSARAIAESRIFLESRIVGNSRFQGERRAFKALGALGSGFRKGSVSGNGRLSSSLKYRSVLKFL